jgi:hypothetical protein
VLDSQAPLAPLIHAGALRRSEICAVPRTPPSRFRPREKRSWRMSRRMRRRLPSLGIILDFCVNLALPRCDLQWSTPQVDLYGLHFDFDKATMRPGNPVTSARVGSCPAATTHNVVFPSIRDVPARYAGSLAEWCDNRASSVRSVPPALKFSSMVWKIGLWAGQS